MGLKMDVEELRKIAGVVIAGIILLTFMPLNPPVQVDPYVKAVAKNWSDYFFIKGIGLLLSFALWCVLIKFWPEEIRVYCLMLLLPSLLFIPDLYFTYQLHYCCSEKPKDYINMAAAKWISTIIEVATFIFMCTYIFKHFNRANDRESDVEQGLIS